MNRPSLLFLSSEYLHIPLIKPGAAAFCVCQHDHNGRLAGRCTRGRHLHFAAPGMRKTISLARLPPANITMASFSPTVVPASPLSLQMPSTMPPSTGHTIRTFLLMATRSPSAPRKWGAGLPLRLLGSSRAPSYTGHGFPRSVSPRAASHITVGIMAFYLIFCCLSRHSHFPFPLSVPVTRSLCPEAVDVAVAVGVAVTVIVTVTLGLCTGARRYDACCDGTNYFYSLLAC